MAETQRPFTLHSAHNLPLNLGASYAVWQVEWRVRVTKALGSKAVFWRRFGGFCCLLQRFLSAFSWFGAPGSGSAGSSGLRFGLLLPRRLQFVPTRF